MTHKSKIIISALTLIFVSLAAGAAYQAVRISQLQGELESEEKELTHKEKQLVVLEKELTEAKKIQEDQRNQLDGLLILKVDLERQAQSLRSAEKVLSVKLEGVSALASELVRRLQEESQVAKVKIDNLQDKIRGLHEELAKQALAKEEAVAAKAVSAQVDLGKISVEESKAAAPKLFQGKILAKDPSYQFVIIDGGGEANLQPGQRLMATRSGKDIGELKVTEVSGRIIVADILDSKTNVRKGDEVKLPTFP